MKKAEDSAMPWIIAEPQLLDCQGAFFMVFACFSCRPQSTLPPGDLFVASLCWEDDSKNEPPLYM
jgi:hypothetical protein